MVIRRSQNPVRAGQFIKQALLAFEQIGADDVRRAIIYAVPTMNGIAVADVEVEHPLFLGLTALFKLPAENGVSQRALLVYALEHQFSHVWHAQFPKFAGHAAHVFCGDTEKPVPSGIFEIPAINLRPGPIGVHPERLPGFCVSYWAG